jgi:hypothetical protein
MNFGKEETLTLWFIDLLTKSITATKNNVGIISHASKEFVQT